MPFRHKVHHTDAKGNIINVTPYTKICRMGYPEIYFDHKKKMFFDPGTLKEADMSRIPEDVIERYLGKQEKPKRQVVNKAEAKPKKRGRPKKIEKVIEEPEEEKGPIVVTADGVEE